MFPLVALSLIPFASAGVAGVQRGVAARDSGCTDVHIILARGNDEPYPGRQGALVDAICARFDSCDYENVIYDIPGDPYCTTVDNGAVAGLSQITAYNKQCPQSLLVLSGYSQGAQVIGDILGGGGGTFYDGCVQQNNSGLDPSKAPGNAIAAALLWGDIRHNADQSFNILDGAGLDGDFPRPANQVSGLNEFASVLQSYCVDTDPICARGDDGNTHTTYFDIYSSDAADWVQSKLGNLPSLGASSSAAASTAVASSSSDSGSASASITSSASASGSSAASSSASASASATITSATSATTVNTYLSTVTQQSSFSIPAETNLSYNETSSIASTLLYSPTVSITPITAALSSTAVAAVSAPASTTSKSTNAAAATPAMHHLNLLGMALVGGALVL